MRVREPGEKQACMHKIECTLREVIDRDVMLKNREIGLATRPEITRIEIGCDNPPGWPDLAAQPPGNRPSAGRYFGTVPARRNTKIFEQSNCPFVEGSLECAQTVALHGESVVECISLLFRGARTAGGIANCHVEPSSRAGREMSTGRAHDASRAYVRGR